MSAQEAKEEILVPVVDVSRWLNQSEGFEEDCKAVAEALHKYGVVIIKNVDGYKEELRDEFLDMMEDYYGLPLEDKMKDVRPELSYQVGATPANVERARADNCKYVEEELKGDNKPITLCPPGKDPKWRYFWRIGERPKESEFPQLNADQVVPESLKDRWNESMDRWGTLMLKGCEIVAEMAAVGFGLEKDTFTKLMHQGPHLLAPTGSDMSAYPVDTPLAGFHYDLNFLTIHGKSRYPGLYAWLRDGTKFPVKVPDGCLLLQAGKQLEWLTGGHVYAGYHEVILTQAAADRAKVAVESGRPPWRVSSTLFSHINSDQTLEPLGWFANGSPDGKDDKAAAEIATKYPPTKAGKYVADELKAIRLSEEAVQA